MPQLETALASTGRREPDTESFPVSALRLGRAMREPAVREDRIAELMIRPEAWGPILAMRGDGTVIDGRHRTVAAGRLGLAEIDVVWFDGDAQEALVEYLRRNHEEGLELTGHERRKAVRRLLRIRPTWSDRRLAALCGLSPKAVGRIRAQLRQAFPDEVGDGVDARVGRDGRVRPVDAAARRAKVAEALAESPSDSLRAIAARVGASPETVRSVRATMWPPQASEPALDITRLDALLLRHQRGSGYDAAAFMSRDDSAATAQFFERTDVADASPVAYACAVPLSRVYEVADDARRRAAFWSTLAECVENRARRR